ncbi:unnamed protein product, partial [Callosobruchus maculatus]
RCQIWRNALGFTGRHKYANITSEQCYSRIRICALHFVEDCFANSTRSRIHSYAVPSLRLAPYVTNIGVSGGDDSNMESPILNIAERKKAGVQTLSVLHSDAGIQTPLRLSAGSPRKRRLSATVKTLQRTISAHKCKNRQETTMEDVIKFLESNFSGDMYKFLKAQLLLLNRSPKGCRYFDDFKQFALSVYFLGPKAYKKFSTYFRLPSKATLHRFTRRWVVTEGFSDFVFWIVKCRVRLLKEKEKDCILCLDEVSLKSHLFYDTSKDRIIGFETDCHNNNPQIAGSALTLMVRGIGSSWKQPIAYFFHKTCASASSLKDIVFQCIRQLTHIGLNVYGVVSDQGSNFYKLAKNILKLTEDDPIFYVDDIKLVYLFDVPHLLKSTRNNFFSYKLLLEEGETRKHYLETFYNLDKDRQFKLAPRLTNDHIYPNNFQKQKVKLATQVFSHSVAVAMHTHIEFNALPGEAAITANFISKMNNLFDLLNSSNLKSFQAFMGTNEQITCRQEMDNF